MAGNAFENLNKIYLSDTFRAWFDKTNEIVHNFNDLEIYGVTAGGYTFTGVGSGITISIGTDGIATIALDLPKSLTGAFSFPSGLTFANFVNVSGLTVDLNPTGSGNGATMYGRVVRTINGKTGDVLFDTITTPSSSLSGDILVYNSSGVTYSNYNLFSDGIHTNGSFHVGSDGGIFFGVTAGGVSSANFISKGQAQFIGATSSGIYLTDNTKPLTVAKDSGADIRFGTNSGSSVFTIGGRNISGQKHSTDNFVLDFSRQSASVGGGGTGIASLNIYDKASSSIPFQFVDFSGSTFNLHFFDANETSGRTSGGATGLAVFGGNPASKGLKEQKRIRLENTDASFEVELIGSGVTTAFAVYGQDSSGPYGTLLTPTLVARRDGTVVIGGVGINDGGITGTIHGALNVASGKLFIGGTMGSSTSTGYQVLTSNGSTAAWRSLESKAFSYEGDVSTVVSGSHDNGIITLDPSVLPDFWNGVWIRFPDASNQDMTGPFSVTIDFPTVEIVGVITKSTEGGVLGVKMVLDGVSSDKFITWKQVYNQGKGIGKYLSPSFTFTGNAINKVSFIPFMTHGQINGTTEGFLFMCRGTYMANFHKLG